MPDLVASSPSRSLHIVAESSAMRRVLSCLPAVARARRTTLLCGATGTGKEVIARALHEHGGSTGPYVAVHCGAIPEPLMEAELFGHTRGAFTGAAHARAGLVRSAARGTLFLDEIDSLSPSAQVKLLRFLETGEYRAVGSDRAERAETWVIAATNQDLGECVKQGRFRADLLYRLDVMRLDLPLLRDRGADIEHLARHFLRGCAAGLRFADDVYPALRTYAWPGNVRELKHRVERAALLCAADGMVDSEALSLGAPFDRSPMSAAEEDADALARELWGLIEHDNLSLGEAIEYCERVLIRAALQAEANNRTRAAHRLGIHIRTIFKKLRSCRPENADDGRDTEENCG